jgi:hypothetical protein
METGNNQHQAMRGQPQCVPAAIFRDAPDLVCHPKSGYGFPQLRKASSGLGEGVRFSHTGTPKSALYRIWFNAYLTT